MARLIQLKEYETEGECCTAGRLTAELPDEWVVIYGAMLVGFAGVGHEVDFFVVGDHGVYLVDDKFFKGRVVAGRGTWEVEFGPVENPVEKVEMVAKKAAGLLREGVPGISDALGSSFFLHAYVCLSGQVDLVRRDRDSTARVFLADRLPLALLGLDRLPSKSALPVVDVRDAIVDYLTAGRTGIQSTTDKPLEAPARVEDRPIPAVEHAPPPAAPHRRRRPSVVRWLPIVCFVAVAVVFVLVNRAQEPVRWDQAGTRVGKTATVYGPVVQSTKKPRWGELSYINIGQDFRPGSATPFYLRIDPEYRAAIEAELKQLTGESSSPWDAYGTKTIWVRAKILADRYGGSYALVTSAGDINVGQPQGQPRYLVAALVAVGGAVAWSAVLIVIGRRRRQQASGERETA